MKERPNLTQFMEQLIRALKEALQGLTLEELKVSQDVLRKIFTNTKD